MLNFIISLVLFTSENLLGNFHFLSPIGAGGKRGGQNLFLKDLGGHNSSFKFSFNHIEQVVGEIYLPKYVIDTSKQNIEESSNFRVHELSLVCFQLLLTKSIY